MDIFGNDTDTTFSTGLSTDEIRDLSGTSKIDITDTTIDLQSTSVLVNGTPITGGAGSVLTEDLDCQDFNITNAGTLDGNILSITNQATITGNSQMKLGVADNFAVTDDAAGPFQTLRFLANNTEIRSHVTHTFYAGLETSANLVGDIGTTTDRFNTLWVDKINGTTKLITEESDFGTPVGSEYVLTDGVNYRIQGTVAMTYGIQMGINNSICGDGLNAILSFDETTRDCQIKSTLGQQVLMSDLTIVNGGGRLSGLSTLGLFDCIDIDTATGVAPFFGRSKRFFLNNVTTFKVYNHGFVKGFGTISVNNCFWNGGAGLSGQVESYYTNYGISFQAGLSCEVNNCKIVLFRGLYFATTEPMVRLGSNLIVGINSVGFNAVEISDNIFHPRGTERGLFVATDCSTELGNIGNNVFISETSNVLLDYGAFTTESQGSYNTPNMIKYIINSNAGIPDSQVSLSSNWTTTNTYTSAALQTIEPAANSEMNVQKVSNRIGVRMNITTTSGFWVPGLITQAITGATANIVYVESANVVFISDQNGVQFDVGQSVSQGAFATTGNAPTLVSEYIFVEKEPRRVGIMATATCEVAGAGDDINFTVGYDEGLGFVADLDGQAETFASNNKPNQAIYISVKQLKFGDKFNLQVSTVGATLININKVHLGIS